MGKNGKKIVYPRGTKLLEVPEFADEIDYEENFNAGIDLSKLTYKSLTHIWWKCKKCKSKFFSTPFLRTTGTGCAYCIRTKVNETNSLIVERPDIENCWDWDLNKLDPNKLSTGSQKRAHFICPKCNKRYQLTVKRWCDATEPCIFCRNHATKIIPFSESIASLYPEIIVDWNFYKNDEDPAHISKYKNKIVHWRCHSCGNEWKARIDMRALGLRNCPRCNRRN